MTPCVTDAGMKAVANLNKLSLLDLANTNVSDAGARELTALPQLGKLHLSFTQVSKGGFADLKKALPNCGIVHNTAK